MNDVKRQAASPESERQNRRLFYLGLGTLAAASGYYAISAEVADSLHRYQGLAILVLAIWPSLLWAKGSEKPFPAFEVFCMTNANLFALPLLNSHEALASYSVSNVSTTAWVVIIYQIALISTHRATGGFPGRSPFWSQAIFADRVMHYMTYGLIISSGYSIISTFFPDVIPYEINSVVRAVCFGIGIVCTFLSARLWGLGQLRPVEKVFMALNIGVQVLSQISSLYLVGGISTLLLLLIGYTVGSRRIPLVFMAVALGLTAVLHNGKSAMRARFWADDVRTTPKLEDTPAFFSDWIQSGLKSSDESAASRELAGKLVDRTSLLHILCLVVSTTPERQPYLGGDTYRFVLPQLIPRFFWPDKPPSHAATYQLAIYYGLQTETSVQSTTIGFGLLAEAYANFGFMGIILLGVVEGFLFKKVRVWSSQSPLISYGGIFLVLLMAWSFQSEFTAAAWISSFLQACETVLGIPFVIRSLFG